MRKRKYLIARKSPDAGRSLRGAVPGGGGGAQAAVPGGALGQVPMADGKELTGAMGMWVTKKNFVKTDLKKIVGRSLDGTKTQWQIPLAGETCWASPEPTKNGLVAVVCKNDKDETPVCTEIGLVDLNKGMMRW